MTTSWTTFQNKTKWANIQNKPPFLSDDQVNWNEVQDKPIVESGSFTPKLTNDADGNQITHVSRSGRYYRIGNICAFSLQLIITINSSARSTTNLQISGLPYAFSSAGQFIPGYCHPTNSNYDFVFFWIKWATKNWIILHFKFYCCDPRATARK